MLTSRDFQKLLRGLVLAPVDRMELEDRLVRARQILREVEVQRTGYGSDPVALSSCLDIVPATPGARPLDDALAPGQGASARVGLVGGDDVWLLFHLRDLDPSWLARGDVEVRMSAWSVPHEGGALVPVPGLLEVVVPPRRVSAASYPRPALVPAHWGDRAEGAFVAGFSPGAAGAGGFGELFRRRLRVELELWADGEPRCFDAADVEIHDPARLGSLYARLLDRLGPRDPWYAGLRLLADRATTVVRRVGADLALHRRIVADVAWALRVASYLEFLTFLGVAEALRGEHPDILTVAEREAFARGPAFAGLRERVDVAAWRRARMSVETCSEGHATMSARRGSVLALLEAHAEDWRRALELAGPEGGGDPELWHRTLRDAERALMRSSRRGAIDPVVARAWRTLLNGAATWARSQGLCRFAGAEAIPAGASLCEASLRGDATLLAELQRRDGEARLEPPVTAVGVRATRARELTAAVHAEVRAGSLEAAPLVCHAP